MSEQDAVLAHLTDPSWSVLEVGPGGHPTPWSGPYESVDHTVPGDPGTAGSEAGVVCTATQYGEMHALPVDGPYDAVVARHVIEHHPDTLLVLREWARVLRPGGVLVVITPDQGRFAGSTVALDPTHVAAFTAPQLQALATHAGFGDFSTTLIDWPRPGWSFCLRAVKL
jgi:SAM-dependent methyltransferase